MTTDDDDDDDDDDNVKVFSCAPCAIGILA